MSETLILSLSYLRQWVKFYKVSSSIKYDKYKYFILLNSQYYIKVINNLLLIELLLLDSWRWRFLRYRRSLRP